MNMLYSCYKYEVQRRNMHFVDDAKTRERIEKIGSWLQNNKSKPGLLLYGETCGTGKTTMARAICTLIGYLYDSSYSSERRSVYTVSALNLAKIYQDDPKYFNRLRNEEMLFIDDLGTEPVSVKIFGNEFSPVTELLYSRYDMQRWTLISSNLKDSQIAERYGTRIDDRFEEMFDRLYFSGESYRRNKK